MTARFKKLLRSEGGSVIPLVGLAGFVLVGAMGFAIDTGRAQLVQSKLLSSADAAALAVGARLSSSDLNAEATKFVNANFPAGYASATVTKVTATATNSGSTITVTAEATMPTTLIRVLGINTVNVNVTSEVTRQTTGLELVLALDNTGSMVSDMDDLKNAANDLVDIVFGADDVATNLFVGLVPFAQSVNIGTSRTTWLRAQPSAYNWGPSSSKWKGCVDERSVILGLDTTDDAPSNANAETKFYPYYWADESNNNWKDGSSYDIYDWGTYSIGPNAYCPTPVTAMTPTKSTVTNAINAMQARGATHVNLGAVWGWRMLSPKWRNLWGGDMNTNALPLNYNTPKMSKALVLMTDGENTFSSSTRTAYGKISDYGLTEAQAVAELNSRLAKVCASVKAAGIIVYSVAFRSPGADIEKLLRDCASKSEFYFDSVDGPALETAFRTIGDSLSNLRVSR